MDGEEGEGEGLREESFFRDEAPVYCPFVGELPGEFEGAAEVGEGSFAEGIAEEDLLQYQYTQIPQFCQHK